MQEQSDIPYGNLQGEDFGRVDSEASIIPSDIEDKKKKISYCGCCSRGLLIALLIGFGCCLIAPSAFLMTIFDNMVGKMLVLKNGSHFYEGWRAGTDPPLFFSYYLFNYTNLDEMISNHSKPKVVQLGPYVYRGVPTKEILEYSEDEITYMAKYDYLFDQELSCDTCSIEDVVVTPSIISLSILNTFQQKFQKSSAKAKLIDQLVKSMPQIKMFNTLTVKEALWGYNDTFLSMITEMVDLMKAFGVPIPDSMVYSPTMALQMNSTAGMEDVGNITILTGNKNVKDIQKVIRWRGLDTAPYWLTKYGNMINGTDGSRAPPFTSRDEPLYMFMVWMCRSIFLNYINDTKVRGIPTYRFQATPQLFDDAKHNPDNKAFCEKDKCWGKGLLPMSTCRPGNAFMSWPHFYEGDPKFAEAIDGLKPDPELHKTFMDVEPITGMGLVSHTRLQMNMMVENKFLTITKPLRNEFNFLPILWFDVGVEIDENIAKTVRDQLLGTQFMLSIIQYVAISVGGTIILCGIVWALKRKFYDVKR